MMAESSGRWRVPRDSTAARRSGPLERIVRARCHTWSRHGFSGRLRYCREAVPARQ